MHDSLTNPRNPRNPRNHGNPNAPRIARVLIDLRVQDLGLMAYGEALSLQHRLLSEVIAARSHASAETPVRMHLLLVEHDPPVITVSRRKSARDHLVADPEQLAEAGVEIAETDRGGDITYHGPGQLVVYPILDLNALGLRVHEYMRLLEQIVIDTLVQFGITGRRDPQATGVWVEQEDIAQELPTPGIEVSPSAKICALGVRISRWASMHGLALNVTTNLEHFQLIVPCGLVGRTVTSMQKELGEKFPGMDVLKDAIIAQCQSAICRERGDLVPS